MAPVSKKKDMDHPYTIITTLGLPAGQVKGAQTSSVIHSHALEAIRLSNVLKLFNTVCFLFEKVHLVKKEHVA